MPGDSTDEATESGNPATRPVTVLVADDQATFRRALRELVAAADGFQLVAEAASGEEAISAAEAVAPHLVIMDKRMPGIGGVAAARLLAARHPEIVVVLVSLEEPDLDVMKSCGACAFINKRDLSTGVLRQVWEDHGRW